MLSTKDAPPLAPSTEIAAGESFTIGRDAWLKSAIILGTATVAIVLFAVQGMRFNWIELYAPFAVVGVLGPCALYYRYKRPAPQFVLALSAVMQLLVFTSAFTMLMYAAAALNAPLADGWLQACDEALGVHLPTIVGWARERPLVNHGLNLAYNTVLIQTICVIVILGFACDRVPLEQFVLRFLIALVVTAALFAAFPAEGPFASYGYLTNESQDVFLEHLRTLRSSERTLVSLKTAEGLVTFPSFHATWAVLLALALWHRPHLFWPLAVLNALVLAATMTTGWHYFTDVLGGIVIAALAVGIGLRLKPWLYAVQPTYGATLT